MTRGLRRKGIVWLSVLLLLGAAVASCSSMGPQYERPRSDHFDGRVFHDDPPVHFGTFRLADNGQRQPVTGLLAALDESGTPANEFWIPSNGDSRTWTTRSSP
jgi:hypothetical protein